MVAIPELIEICMVARAINWTTRKTRRFFTSGGLAGQLTPRGQTFIVRSHFEATMPHIYRLFVEKYATGELISARGGHRTKGNQRGQTEHDSAS